MSSGVVWLYHYSWYGLRSYKLAVIEDGVAHIRLTEQQLKNEVEPHPNTEAYVLALRLPPNRWYRTEDIAPEDLWRDLLPRLNTLGEVNLSPSGETQVVLPEPTLRRLVLEYEDGRPAANVEVPLSLYLYDRNHCGQHSGLPLGTFLTDEGGAIEFRASAVPLYLDLQFYDRRGEGPAGPAYAANIGLKAGAEAELVLRKAWELPVEEHELQVVDNGHPVANVSVNQKIRNDECGAWWGQVGQTDADGTARFGIVSAATERLWLVNAEGDERPLTEAELHLLFRDHRLSLTW